MTDAIVQLPADGTGKYVRTTETTVDGRLVHEQVMQIANSTDSIINPAKEDGNLATIAETDFATSAKQDTGNSSLSSIDGKVTACNTGAVVLTTGTASIGQVTNIESAHAKIHTGTAFTVCKTLDVGNGANLDILLITPNTTTRAHLTYELECELEFHFNIFEDATVSANGTGLTIYNRSRNSATASTLSAYHTPTVTGTGTELRCWHGGSGRNFGGGDRGTHELILKQNTIYLFRLNNQTTNNNYMAIKIDWYEV